MCHPGATTAVCMHLTSSMGMSLGCMGTWAPVLLDTNTFLTQSHPSTASSTVSFRGMVFPPRTAWSVVITTLAEAMEEESEEEEEESEEGGEEGGKEGMGARLQSGIVSHQFSVATQPN